MVLLGAAVGVVVDVLLDLAFRVGDLGQVAVGVVGVADGLAERADLFDHAVEFVVGEAVGVARTQRSTNHGGMGAPWGVRVVGRCLGHRLFSLLFVL